MSKKTSANAAPSQVEPTSEESSQHIWLAGLGAMAKAQSQGTKAFEALIAEGLAFQRKTHQAAQAKITEATEQFSHLAKDFSQQTSGRIDRLEHLFEDRVARALTRLGLPSAADLEALQQRVSELEKHIQSLEKGSVTGSVKSSFKTALKTGSKAALKAPLKEAPMKAGSKAALKRQDKAPARAVVPAKTAPRARSSS